MKNPPFSEYLGIEYVRRDQDSVELSIALEPHHLNRRGVAHGGVVASLLDSALGAAVIASMPEQWWCATTSLSTQFIAGAGPGRLNAVGRVDRRGSKVAFASGEARDASGRLIATAQGTWHLWSRKPGTLPAPPARSLAVRGSSERIEAGKIVAVGRNYADHVAEMGAPQAPLPVVFLKPPQALTQGDGVLRIPTDAGEVSHEVELVVVIGSPCRAVAAADALAHVYGFAVGLDLTLRDVQREAKKRGEPWTLSKGFDGSAPVGEVVRRDEVGDGAGLEIALDVNGETRQRADTSRMLHPVGELIAHISRHMSLGRGDLIFTGTPAGVGPLLPGDRVEARLARVGTLTLRVEAGG